jgi:hypothetical protein
LLEALRPPEGYRLDRAVGTSFTLDLLALLTAPLAFTFFDWEDEEGRATADPVALLEAVRRHARRIRMFCQAGEIQAPRDGQPLFAYLEPCVVEVRSPQAGGVFHPKVWVLRYVDDEEALRYRVLVLSRNLTFDRSWDTVLVLDGAPVEGGPEIARNRALVDFVAALPGLAVRAMDGETRGEIAAMAEELRHVVFVEPEGFKGLAFHAFGIRGYENTWPFESGSRLLVLSPFVTESALARLGKGRKGGVLVSRSEALHGLSDEVLEAFPERYVLAAEANHEDGLEGDGSREASAADDALVGLHAKLFVIEKGRRSRVFTGSANATGAAFGRNVEFLVELHGGWQKSGIEALVGEGDGRAGGLRDLLEPWVRVAGEEDPDAMARKGLEQLVEQARSTLGGANLVLHVLEPAHDSFDFEVRGRIAELPEGVEVSMWPSSLPRGRAVMPAADGESLARFEGLSFEALTAFLGFELRATGSGLEHRVRFVRNFPLVGAPVDREERVLRSLLKDRATVLRLIYLLLSSDELSVAKISLRININRYFSKLKMKPFAIC